MPYKSIFVSFLFALLVTCVFPAHEPARAQETAGEIRIGVSIPLSGNAQILGDQFLRGGQLAVDHHNASSEIQAKVLTIDDNCNADLGRSAAEALLKQDLTIVTGFLCNDPAYEAAEVMRDSGIPLLVAGAQSVRLIKDRERQEWNLWRMAPGDNDLADVAAQMLAQKWQDKPFAIIDDGTVLGRNLADQFRASMEANGMPAQFNDTYRPNQSTQARMVRRLQRAGVTSVFVGGDAADIAMIAQNASELAIPLEIAGAESLSIFPYLPEEQRPPAGVLAILRLNGQLNPSAERLTAELAEREIDPEPYVYIGYAAMQIAMASAGNTPEETTANLKSMTFDTVLGKISFAADGSNTNMPYALFEWVGDGFIEIQP